MSKFMPNSWERGLRSSEQALTHYPGSNPGTYIRASVCAVHAFKLMGETEMDRTSHMANDSCSTNSKTASHHLVCCSELAAESKVISAHRIYYRPCLPNVLSAPPTHPRLLSEPQSPWTSSLKSASRSVHPLIPGGKPPFLHQVARSAPWVIPTHSKGNVASLPTHWAGSFSQGRASLQRQNQVQQAQQTYPAGSLNSALGFSSGSTSNWPMLV